MTIKKAKEAAREILNRFGLDLPIDIRAIVEAHGISIHEEKIEGTVSGILIIKEKKTDLLINDSHPSYRQRFTLAHELGHFLLHRDIDTVFIDESPLFFRDTKSGYGIDESEVEANAFAAELLMPEGVLRKAVRDKPFDANDDAAVRRLAARFGVSAHALTIRLTKLALISA